MKPMSQQLIVQPTMTNRTQSKHYSVLEDQTPLYQFEETVESSTHWKNKGIQLLSLYSLQSLYLDVINSTGRVEGKAIRERGPGKDFNLYDNNYKLLATVTSTFKVSSQTIEARTPEGSTLFYGVGDNGAEDFTYRDDYDKELATVKKRSLIPTSVSDALVTSDVYRVILSDPSSTQLLAILCATIMVHVEYHQ